MQELGVRFTIDQALILLSVWVGKVVISKGGMYVGRGYVSDRLFKLNVMTIKPMKNNNNNASSSAYLLESSNL